MNRVLATLIKEWHLMRRDLSGLALLFGMPMFLIVIMALVQDAPFRDYREVRFDVLFLDRDGGQVGQALKKGLQGSGQFNLLEQLNGRSLSDTSLREQIHKGNFSIGIIVPERTTAEVVNSANLIANEMGRFLGVGASLPHRESRDSVRIGLLFDPVSKPTFRMAIMNAVEKFTARIQSDIVLDRIARLSRQQGADTGFNLQKHLGAVGVKEISTGSISQMATQMNSVQHNVPAWAIFGMFFLIMVIAESRINERIQGSHTRLLLIPGSRIPTLTGKSLFYILLALMQFTLMLMVGFWVMPLVGLPSLVLPPGVHWLLLMVLCIAICAVSLGLLMGSLFRTTNQALPVSAISVVILSAVGGVWVPVEVLPNSLKLFSVISPMRWGLMGINNLMIRQSGLADILLPCAVLLGGSVLQLALAFLIERRRVLS